MNKVNTLWEEKYRPKILDEYVCSEDIKEKLEQYIDEQDIPHLILYGDAGGGKTTLAKLLANNIKCDYIYINASDENGIDVVRTKIKNFAGVASFNPLKIIHLDEGDALTPEAQDALKSIVEIYSAKTRFIFTTNHFHKLIPQIKSRCTIFEIKPDDKNNVADRLIDILNKEEIEFDNKDVASIIRTHFPDIRACIRTLQHNVVKNKLVLTELNVLSDVIKSIIQSIKKPSAGTWKSIRQTISDNSIRNFIPLYKEIYNSVESFKNPEEVVIMLSEHEFQDYFVPDKEINFMACLSKILKIVK